MHRGLAILATFFWLTALPLTAPALENRLADHLSPYLAMHGDDPVDWQRWRPETLEIARQTNKPLLISIGYFACHWCHVMQAESYRDPEVASLMNRYFVPVKVDRELEPALDAHLIEFVEMTRGHAGWPLNVVLTPEGYPVIGMTYVPRDDFERLLGTIGRIWQQEPEQLSDRARDFMLRWQAQTGRKPVNKAPFSARLPGKFVQQALELGDEFEGGFGQQNKFPMVPQLDALLWLSGREDNEDLDAFLRLTLDQMAAQGLHDQAEGGFFRYVVDPHWHTPHYEKMLYDNAQLAALYLDAGQRYASQAYLDVGLATLDFMIERMQLGNGAFMASFSAVDTQGREGFYYLFRLEELRGVLDREQFEAVRAAWFGDHAPDSEFGSLPRWQDSPAAVADSLGWRTGKLEQVLSGAAERMSELRGKRTLPADEKPLAAWNGLALSALARGREVSKSPLYREAGQRLASYLLSQLDEGRQLSRARIDGQVLGDVSLQDYALVARGLWDWCRGLGDEQCETAVAELVTEAWNRYYRDGRWLISDRPLIPMLGGKLAVEDGPLFSSTAVISFLSREHPRLRADRRISGSNREHLAAVNAELADSIFWYASYLRVLPASQPLR